MHSKLCFGIKNTLMHLNLNTSISNYNACQSFHIKKVRKSIKLIFVWNIITGIFFSCNNAKKPRDFREKKRPETFANKNKNFANFRETFRIYTCKREMFLIYQYHFSLKKELKSWSAEFVRWSPKLNINCSDFIKTEILS